MIATDLIAVYDHGNTPDRGERWRAFSIALLELVRQWGEPTEFVQEIVDAGVAAWGSARVDPDRLAGLRLSVWRHLDGRREIPLGASNKEDAALRAALFGLDSGGDRDVAVEGAGWVQDFLTGALSREVRPRRGGDGR